MGGNAFEDTEPLTPEEYELIVGEIQAMIQHICIRIQPYIPLPEKEAHGDVDFLLLLKPNHTLRDIQQLLSIGNDCFTLNNNQTANSVYRRKQVDFNVADNEHDFQLCRFYKSYGGIGAFLGLFLPSRFVKLNEAGLVCCAYHEHIKMEHLVCDSIEDILYFYGLDPARYFQGFTTRGELFAYLRGIRFLQEEKFLSHTTKHQTKIMKAFQEFIRKEGPQPNPHFTAFEDARSATLQHFKKGAQFEEAWGAKLAGEEEKKSRQAKWNGMHIMQIFGVDGKRVNGFKRQFESSFPSKEKYEEFVQTTPFADIVQLFAEVCKIAPQQQPL